jgi:hypothetical protein
MVRPENNFVSDTHINTKSASNIRVVLHLGFALRNSAMYFGPLMPAHFNTT